MGRHDIKEEVHATESTPARTLSRVRSLYPHGTSDAVFCVSEFFKYLEIGLHSTFKAKLGHKRQLETKNLTNLQSMSALSHPAIQKTQVHAHYQRVRLVQPTVKQNEDLRKVFLYYCSYGEVKNYSHMTRTQFLKFCRDCQLVTEQTDMLWLTLLFERMNAEGRAYGEHENRFSGLEFVQALAMVARVHHPDIDVLDAFNKVLNENIMPNLKDGIKYDPYGEALARPDVMALFSKPITRLLGQLFNFYAKDEVLISTAKVAVTWKEQQLAQSHMNLEGWLRMAHDYEMIPHMLTTVQLTRAFRQAKFGAKKSRRGGNTEHRLSQQEFFDAIGRAALISHRYKPPVIPPATIDFKDSYDFAAKRMWNDIQTEEDNALAQSASWRPMSSTQESRRSPSLPGSECLSASFASGSPASPRALASPSTGTQLVMQSAPTTLNRYRPPHLKNFTVDWVAKPIPPIQEISEDAVRDPFQSAGIYTAETGLRPEYRARMEAMQENRFWQEQDAELARLDWLQRKRNYRLHDLTMKSLYRMGVQDNAGQIEAQVMERQRQAANGRLPPIDHGETRPLTEVLCEIGELAYEEGSEASQS